MAEEFCLECKDKLESYVIIILQIVLVLIFPNSKSAGWYVALR